MFHSIGTRRGDGGEGDVVDRLVECHGRIRDVLALAEKIATTPDVPADELRAAAERVRRYLTEALPLHVADEEQELLPRLRGRSVEVDAALATMHGEHHEHDPLVGRMIAACEAADPAAVGAVVATLAPAMREHLELEEKVVFPALRALPIEDQDAIVAAMKARRTKPSR
jgi:iron-sulfur cluster repair protein YtfE (RIC family)